MLMGLSPGIDLALWLTGLTSGALNSKIGLYMMAALNRVLSGVVDTIFEGGICKSRGVLSQERMPDQVGSRGQSI